MKPNALARGDSAIYFGRHVYVVAPDADGASFRDAETREYDWAEWKDLGHAVPFALRFYAPDGSLSNVGRRVVERKRNRERRPLSNRRIKKLHAAALRLDRDYNRAALEAADARLLSYAY
jgi:hypothetical protein